LAVKNSAVIELECDLMRDYGGVWDENTGAAFADIYDGTQEWRNHHVGAKLSSLKSKRSLVLAHLGVGAVHFDG
jgi:hypothetical protein